MRTKTVEARNIGSVSGPRSVLRIMSLLNAITSSKKGISLTTLSARISSPKSSVLTLLRPLVAEQYLNHIDGLYFLGPNLFGLAANIGAKWELAQQAQPFMVSLEARLGETVLLARLDEEHDTISYINKVESRHSIRYTVTIGEQRRLYCSGSGKVFLAFLPRPWLEAYLARTTLVPITKNTVTNKRLLRRQLEEIQASGVAVTYGESFDQLMGVAAPIYASDGSLIAAMAIGGPLQRVRRMIDKCCKTLRETAAELSALHLPPQFPSNKSRE